MRRSIAVSAFALSVVIVAAPSAWAVDPVLTFGYTDLVGNAIFPERGAASMLFTAADTEDTDGDVTREIAPPGTAEFSGDLVPDPFFSMFMEIEPRPGENPVDMVNGVGTITLTDVDGDTIVGDVDGLWINNGSANFIGRLSNVAFTSDDNTFDGTSGSISLAGLIGGTFPGNVMTLAFGNWFTDDLGQFRPFSEASTLAQGAIVPEPATLGLIALATIPVLARRRRR